MSIRRLFYLAIAVAILCGGLIQTANANTVTIAPSKDNNLYESATGALSNAKGQYLFFGRTLQPAGQSLRRALIQFNIASTIPAGSTINSVQFRFFLSTPLPSTDTLTLHLVSADWGEGTSAATGEEGTGAAPSTGDATWLHRLFNTTLWTTAGGDFNASPSASASFGGVGQRTLGSTAQLVADVQAWLNTPANNRGWLIRGNEAVTATAQRIASRENSITANRPQLIVDYTPPPIANNIVWPGGKQTFENMTAGDDVTRITGWPIVGPGPNFTVKAANGPARPGTTSTTWLKVIDTDPATSSRFYTAFANSVTSPTGYTWTCFVNLETSPPAALAINPKITVQHQNNLATPQNLYGVEFRPTGAFLVTMDGGENVLTSTPLYSFNSTTGLGKWVKLEITADFQRARVFAAFNGSAAVSLPFTFPAGVFRPQFRLCYRGSGTGNVMTINIDDIALTANRLVPVELSTFGVE